MLIEAQAAGLPVFASDSTTVETLYSEHMRFLSLRQSAAEWAEEIIRKGCVSRKDMTESVRRSGFDIRSMIDNMEQMYREGI